MPPGRRGQDRAVPAGTPAAIELWRADLPVTGVLVSPLFADLGGLGPLTVFSGTRDITNPDTRGWW